MDLRARIATELNRRTTRNALYSRRAFARDLGVRHTDIARVLNRRRRLTSRMAERIGKALHMTEAQITQACISANAEWLAQFVAHRRFAPNSRSLAMLTGMSIDDVNVALHHLLYHRQLTMTSPTDWSTNT